MFRTAALLVVLAACSESTPPVNADAAVTSRPTPGICVPGPGGTGNDLNVGAHCTSGGQECVQYSTNAILLCSVDLDPEGENFCIKVGCSNHAACGAQGCCTGREGNSTKACVPKGCVTEGDLTAACPPIPGLSDAGTSSVADAG